MGPGSRLKTAEARLTAGFALLLAVMLLMVGVVTFESYQTYSYYLDRQSASDRLYGYTEQLRVDLLNIETGKRGFILSGDDRFLEPYRTGQEQFDGDLARARDINAEVGIVPREDFSELDRQTGTLLGLFEDQIQARRSGPIDEADIRTNEGKSEMDASRAILDDIQTRALESSREARLNTENAILWQIALSVLLGLLALGLGIFSLVYVRRGIIVPLKRLRDDTIRVGEILKRNGSDRDLVEHSREISRWEESNPGAMAQEIAEVREAFGVALGRLQGLTENTRSLVAGIEDPLVAVDSDGSVTFFNEAASRMTGYEESEAKGRKVSELIGVESGSRDLLAEAMSTGETARTSEETLRRRDGEVYYISATAAPLRGRNQEVVGALMVMRDITDRKHAQQATERARIAAEDASRAKSAFLANMSHEIRTPMNGVIGMTELLMNTDLDDEQREYVTIVNESGDSLLGIINDVLDFSKIEAGKIDVEEIPFDLRRTVENAVTLLAGRAHSRGLELAYNVEERVPTYLKGDPGRIRQVLTNLVGNAIKFTEHGEVVVRVDLEGDPGPDRRAKQRVKFSVTDTGIGMNRDQMDHIFDSFSQADTSTTRRYGGTGLGLAISRQLVQLMDGDLSVSSEPEAGSEFSFTLPMEIASGKPQRHLQRTLDLVDYRILVVDDNETNRLILTRQLTSWNIRNSSCVGPHEALAELKSAAKAGDPYDLAVLDLQMPHMDGVTLAGEMQRSPHIPTPLMILLTSVGRQQGESERVRASGIYQQLTKPVKQSELYETLIDVTRNAGIRVGENGAAGRRRLREGASVSGNGAKVLLAEDNLINQRVAVRMLELLGYRVDIASDGQEALASVTGNPSEYSVVLMDVQMPVMDGYATTAEIRSFEASSPGGRRLPIIAMTANALEGDRGRALEAGMDDYLSKPVKSEDLARTLKQWVTSDYGDDGSLEKVVTAVGSGVPGDPVDHDALDEIRALQVDGDGPDLLTELIDVFLEDSETKMEELREAAGKQDAHALRGISHSLKGASGSIGARLMAGTLAEIEVAAANGDLSHLGPLIVRLETEYEATGDALRSERSDSKGGD